MHRDNLCRLIRTAIIEDRLPRSGDKPRVFGGRGDGQICACCHVRIEPTDVQYDVDCKLGAAVHTLSMHMGCFEVWEAESRALSTLAGHSVCEDAA
jgi:hypothetical protein